jgi:hypothetical protein
LGAGFIVAAVADIEADGTAADDQFLESIPGLRVTALGAVIHFFRQPALPAGEAGKERSLLFIQPGLLQVHQGLGRTLGAGAAMVLDTQKVQVFIAFGFIPATKAGNHPAPYLQFCKGTKGAFKLLWKHRQTLLSPVGLVL